MVLNIRVCILMLLMVDYNLSADLMTVSMCVGKCLVLN